MKYLILFILAYGPVVLRAEPGREVAKKEVTKHFAFLEEASRWSFAALPFDQWLDFVCIPGWELLHSEQSDEAYYALFRRGDYLIFWHLDRVPRPKEAVGQSSIEITANQDGKSVWEPPASRQVSLEYRLEYPHGTVLGCDQRIAYKIKDGFHDTLIFRLHRDMFGEGKSRDLYRQEVLWAEWHPR